MTSETNLRRIVAVLALVTFGPALVSLPLSALSITSVVSPSPSGSDRFVDEVTSLGNGPMTEGETVGGEVFGAADPLATNDTAVRSATVSPRSAGAGTPVRINATVANEGDGNATFQVQAKANSTVVDAVTVALAPASSTNVSFIWNTTSVAPASYAIIVNALPVPEETDTSDNLFDAGIVAILPPLRTVLTATPPATDVLMTVTFTCQPTAGVQPYRFEWDFGSGPVPGEFTMRRGYPTPGPKTVRCIVTDAGGARSTASTTVTIAPIPTVIATVNRWAAAPDQPLIFTALATGGTGTLRYTWDFGDGTVCPGTVGCSEGSGTGAPVTHAYSNEDQYLVILSVADAVEGKASTSLTVTISGLKVTATQSAVRLDLVPQQNGPSQTGFVTFTAFATGGAGGPYTYEWDFDDGSPKRQGSTASHRYEREGRFTPYITVSDGSGTTHRLSLAEIEVRAPVAALSVPPEAVATVASAIAVGLGVGLVLTVRRRRRRRRWGPRPH